MEHLHLHSSARWNLRALPRGGVAHICGQLPRSIDFRGKGKHIKISRACSNRNSNRNGNCIRKEAEAEVEEDSNTIGFELTRPYKLIGLTSLAFVICNMDKVNLSVAIIPMSHQLGWNASTAGLVQSSFFWGYALSQLPGGWLAKQLTGRKVLEFGVLGWSLATTLVPVVAGFMPGLIISRIMVGIGEGVSPAAATELIARIATGNVKKNSLFEQTTEGRFFLAFISYDNKSNQLLNTMFRTTYKVYYIRRDLIKPCDREILSTIQSDS